MRNNSDSKELRDPTVNDWSAAVAGYISEAYGMDPFEFSLLATAITEALIAENFDPNPHGMALPLRVREQIAAGAEFSRSLAAESIGRGRGEHHGELVIDPGIWADFVCRYIEYSEALRPDHGIMLWRRLCEVFEGFDLQTRNVVFVSVPLQQALPLEDSSPMLDVAAVR